ncbi:hypothetical protein Bca4012_103071 [Brassica carinata]
MGRLSAFASTGRLVPSVGDALLVLTDRSFLRRCYFEEIRVLKASLRSGQSGHSYFIVRGEILGFMKDEQLRKHLPRMFSLIKNESWGSRRSDTALVSTINDADQDQRMLLLGLAGTL